MGALVRVLREYPCQYPREESSQPAKWLGRGVGCDWGVSLEVVPELGLISWEFLAFCLNIIHLTPLVPNRLCLSRFPRSALALAAAPGLP